MSTIWYFSHPVSGSVKGCAKSVPEGNTSYVTQLLKQQVGATTSQIIPIDTYPTDCEETISRAKLETENQILPAIKEPSIDLLSEDVWFIGYPNWLGTLPRPVMTFLTTVNTQGKIIYPFCTHGGSGLGQSQLDIQRLCPQAQVKTGLAIRGTKVERSNEAITNWLSQYY